MSFISWNSWNESNLDRVIEQFDPLSFFEIPSTLLNSKGIIRYSNVKPVKLTCSNWDYYTPFKGWICYSLSDSTQINSEDSSDEWIVGFHGFTRDTLQSLRATAQKRLKIGCNVDNERFANFKDVGPNAPFFNQSTCRKGILLTSNLEYMADCRLIEPIKYNKHCFIQVALQCQVHSLKIRIPECSRYRYYIINDPAYDHLLERFKQVQHLRLTFTFLDTNECNIVKHFSSFSALNSLIINLDTDSAELKLKERLVHSVFCQPFPLLQRLYINGYHMEAEIMDNEFTFRFPSLLYVQVDKLDHYLTVQLLNQCRQLCSFSAEIYHSEIFSHSTSQSSMNSSDMTQFRKADVTENSNIELVPISTTLIAMTALNLKWSSYDDFNWWENFLKHLLSCCLNLFRLFLDTVCVEGRNLLDVDWWTDILLSNKKLEHISLTLHWSTRNYESDYDKQVARKFQSSIYFNQLKANVTHNFYTDFPWFLYDLSIKN
ncbi:unnamed protein product [Rotaria sp. Silwood2]|nr:unnamed protein product [Rotaria sp. Silwood2]CAF4289841.1 unnamed protein product [Rotaria sp. Silwood2]